MYENFSKVSLRCVLLYRRDGPHRMRALSLQLLQRGDERGCTNNVNSIHSAAPTLRKEAHTVGIPQLEMADIHPRCHA
jgi:hypothetical protein